jgi:hypothetical protein
MLTPTDLAAFDAAWTSWADSSRSPPPSGLIELVERLRDAADREVRASARGPERAEAIARQISFAVALQRLRDAAAGRKGDARGFTDWRMFAALARAASGEARAELAGYAVRAGGGAGHLEPRCLLELAPLLDAGTARAWALAALSTEGMNEDKQGTLLGVLPEEDVERLLGPRLDRAVGIADQDERWNAVDDLLGEVPEETRQRWLRWATDESLKRHGVAWGDAYRLPEDEPEGALEQALCDQERACWGAPHTAWRLGDRARALPEAERGPVLDLAIDAFAAIALTPTSPGNDEGPFWAIARMLDEAQVRRALAVVDRMEAADWKGDLCASRAALIGRLARLGHPDEAEGLIPRIGTVDALAGHFRAVAWGGVLGARLALDPGARFDGLPAGAAEDPEHHDGRWRYRVVETVIGVFRDCAPPDPANIEALIGFALSFEPRYRQLALEDMIQGFPTGLPARRWLDLVLAECEGEGRVAALLCLAGALRDASGDPVPALRRLLAYLDERPCADPVDTFEDISTFRDRLSPEDGLAPWAAYLRHRVDHGGGHGSSFRDFRDELPAVLVWLGGPETVLSVGRAIAAVASR